MEIFPQILINVLVKKKIPVAEIPALSRQIVEVEEKLRNHGRLLIRYSGTENKLRIMLKGENYDEIKNYAEELADSVRKFLG